MGINLDDLLRHYRSHIFEDYQVKTPHTGVISFEVEEGQAVEGPSGRWLQRPGTLLYILEREKNAKRIYASWKGQVTGIRSELEGHFVEADELVLFIRHRLDREEIIDRILTQMLTILRAPQQARYFLSSDILAGLEKRPEARIAIGPGDEVVIMSLMKRDTPISYRGEPGVLYKVYFRSGDIVEQGSPLLGVCPSDRLQYMQKVIQRIRTDWED